MTTPTVYLFWSYLGPFKSDFDCVKSKVDLFNLYTQSSNLASPQLVSQALRVSPLLYSIAGLHLIATVDLFPIFDEVALCIMQIDYYQAHFKLASSVTNLLYLLPLYNHIIKINF